ncbi:hypothetical protein TrST_g9581 [Triparma strigata]|uniref:ABC transporter domain-containing protein n=1 Tax=Triparma strigata TaxID=1606541 RepID=A0A9W7BZE9_9STRA|nr:hypothetical protein TrST_g9581 [Triparma strigata]
MFNDYIVKNSNPFLVCNKVCNNLRPATDFCQKSYLAIISNSSELTYTAFGLKTYIETTYPKTANDPNDEFTIIFPSMSSLNSYITSPSYPTSKQIGFTISLSSTSSGVSTVLRTNGTFHSNIEDSRPGIFTTPDTSFLFNHFANGPSESCKLKAGAPKDVSNICSNQYMQNGVLTLQRLTTDYVGSVTTSSRIVGEGGVSIVQFPNDTYDSDGFWGNISSYVPLFYLIAYIYPVLWTVKIIIVEKERRLLEIMMILGVDRFTISSSHWIDFTIVFFITGLGVAGVSTAIFEGTSGGYLFLLILIFGFAIVSFCFLCASVFNRSKIGSILSSMFFVVGYFITFAADPEDGDAAVMNIVSLHPMAAFSYGIQTVAKWEDTNFGMSASEVDVSPFVSGYKYTDSILMLAIDTVIYLLLSYYFSLTISSVGVPLPFYFPFTKKYWCTSHRDPESPSPEIDYVYENPGPSAVKSVEIINLTKTYGTKKTAVDGLTLTFFKNQITSLLGHNGAGKTSLLSMLTGMTSVTSGEAYIEDVSVKDGMKEIRKDLGFCPQHDVLFDYLTVEEHLRLFEGLKGSMDKDKAAAEQKIQDTMAELALASKASTLSMNLSGGQKRKLSIGIAFAGSVGVIFLDEPTSGMDVHSRRFAWNYVRKMRDEGRTIILSTHFLDEADILSDRVAIMSDSRLRCVGSPMFLKNAYGVGYQLNVETNCSHDSLKSLISSSIPESKVITDVGTELTFQLPATSQHLFPDVLTELQELKDNNAIVTYGVGVTTLESVFTVIEEQLHSDAIAAVAEAEVDVENNDKKDTPDPQSKLSDTPPTPLVRDPSTFGRHLGVLLLKRVDNAKRDRKSFLLGNLFPIVLNAIGFLLALLISNSQGMGPLTLSLDEQNPSFAGTSAQNPIFINAVDDPSATFACYKPSSCNWNPIDNTTPNPYCGNPVYDNPSSGRQCTMGAPIDTAFTSDTNAEQIPVTGVGPSTTFEFLTELLTEKDAYPASLYGAIMYTFQEGSDIVGGSSFTTTVQTQCSGLVAPLKPQTNCSNFGHYGFSIATNFTAIHSSVLYQNVADELLLRSLIPSSDFKIATTLHPLPLTHLQEKSGDAVNAFISWFIMIASFPFILASMVAFVVRENETGSKYLQKISGVSTEAYWISSYVFDLCSYTVTAGIIVALMFAFGVKGLTTTDYDTVGGIVALLFLFGPAGAGFTYIISFFFDSPASAQGFVVVFNFLVGLAAPLACYILLVIDWTGNKAIVDGITWGLRWIPSFAFGHGLLFSINASDLSNREPSITSVFSVDVMLYDLIFLAVTAPIYLFLTIMFDRYMVVRTLREWFRCACCKCCRCQKNNQIASTDDDLKLEEENELRASLIPIDEEVLAQAGIVEASLADEINTSDVVIDKLSKVYPNGKVAVNEMSLAVNGEIFGLLGVNGAGKTSLIKVLVGDELVTSGNAYLRGNSVRTDMLKCKDEIGYCPQFDSLFDCMTGREHLSFYGRIKGIRNIKEVVTEKLKSVGISDVDADKPTKSYSGGMRRKISFSIATIAAPPVVFLDEPSTGMDPVSRRKMWKTISELECTMFLTTHSMEECEALCHRLTIMVDGKLTCIGSAQRLKDRYGMGYLVKVKLAFIQPEHEAMEGAANGDEAAVARISTVVEDRVSKFTTFLTGACPSTVISERNELSVSYSIEKQDVSGIADLFRLIQDTKVEYHVEDYSVSQTSLEDIFRGFSKENEDLAE